MKSRIIIVGALALSLMGCEDEPSSSELSSSEDFDLAFKRAQRSRKNAKEEPAKPVEEAESDRPEGRAALVLTRESFAQEARDPFESRSLGPQKPVISDLPRKRQREVRFSGHNFEDLRLIAIVRSGKSIPPRALFVASDGVSKPIAQGEYFSRSEVLLASVNSDYVEIEIVDEELAQGLNMEQGERRAIYLKQD